MKTVRDIMVPISEYPVIGDTEPLHKAIKMLHDSFCLDDRNVILGHRSILVQNAAGELVGILTIRTMLSAIDAEIGPSWADFFIRPEPKGLDMPVRNVMRPVWSVFLKPDDTVADAIHKMLRGKVNILPVMEKDRPVGVVRSIELFQVLGELLT
jgi:CBS domain-containing protein